MQNKALEGILQAVEKPARYTGGEWNMVTKQNAGLHFLLCFPDVYEIGMSHLGSRILYHILNECEDFFCERAYAPWPDMENALRAAQMPLFSLETKRPLSEFHIVGFSLLYEMCYTNILTMLELGRIPLRSCERREDSPIIIAGGPCACNPEPLADILDAVLIGDGEEVILEVANTVLHMRRAAKPRQEILHTLALIPGVYVPGLYEAEYEGDTFLQLKSKEQHASKIQAPKKITRRVVQDLENTPYIGKPVVPNLGIVHDRIALELFRGCTRGCRFCQAGYIYRPVRERKKETLRLMANDLVKDTGYDEISLFSLSSSDYSDIHELIPELLDDMQAQRVSISLPSLRVDRFMKDDLERMQTIRKSGLTFAPEAGTQRLRDIINKGVTEEDLLRVARESFEAGWTSLKLYFMIGLPFEQDEDIMGIAELARKVSHEFNSLPREKRGKGLRLAISASSFVPKPFTPFQWVAQDTIEELRRKQKLLASALKGIRGVEFRYHDPVISMLEAVFSRGDRRLTNVLIEAYRRGCRFDSWAEHFRPQEWREAFSACGVNPAQYANRERPTTESLPWGHIDMLVKPEYMKEEYRKARLADVTQDCRSGCNGCFGTEYADLCPIQ